MSTLELVHVVAPQAIERARRLEVALQLLKAGYTRRQASGTLQERFSMPQPSAWRLVDMAHDLVGDDDR